MVVFIMLGMPTWWWRILSRIVLIPVVAAISYEIIRFSADFGRYRLVRGGVKPSMALQGPTTRGPDAGAIQGAGGAGRLDADEEGIVVAVDEDGAHVEEAAGGGPFVP